MSDPDTLRALASIAAERGAWPAHVIERVDEQAVEAAWRHAHGRERDALTALLGATRRGEHT